jgi:hypothetical protein
MDQDLLEGVANAAVAEPVQSTEQDGDIAGSGVAQSDQQGTEMVVVIVSVDHVLPAGHEE